MGRRPSLEAIRAGAAREVLVARSARSTEGLRAVLAAARAAGIPVTRVAEETVAELSGGTRHQGVAARIGGAVRLDEPGLARMPWAEDAVVLVLDGVTDPHNVGAAARTAEGAGVQALVLRRRRGAGMTPAATKASAGALLHLPVAEVANVTRALQKLKESRFWVVGLEGSAGQDIHQAEPPRGRLALVVGSEGAGLSRLVRETCDELVAIPMRGKVESLNVSVAVGVALFGYALKGGREDPLSGPKKGQKKGS